MMNRMQVFVAAAALATAVPVMAQGNGKIPPGQRPPAGLCRIWIDGVPPGRQPAATDCATAVANRPANARVITSDGSVARRRADEISNGDVVIMNGQRCVRRVINGRISTTCADQVPANTRVINGVRVDQNGRIINGARVDRNGNVIRGDDRDDDHRFEAEKDKKGKKHGKGHKHGDHDGDHDDRDGDR